MSEFEGRKNPYIGVNGVVNELCVEPSGVVWRNPQGLLLEHAADETGLFAAGHNLALGVHATYATQIRGVRQRRDQDFTYGNEWYPVGAEEFTNALHRKGRNPNVMGVAQAYAGPHPYGPNAEHYEKFIATVMSGAEPWAGALRFDSLRWYEKSDAALQFVGETKRKYQSRELKTILECGREAMKALQPEDVAHKLEQHADSIDYVVFDASGGEGRRLQSDVMDDYLDAVYASDRLSSVGFAVAGGLTSDAVKEDLPYLVDKYPGLSWELDEVKSHVRSNIGKHALQMDMARDFIRASVEIIPAR